MAQEVRGVIAPGKNEPVRLETIVVPDPGPGEAVVKIQACGVCHTDLHYKQGGINDDFPFLLGHEAAGVVESVGDGRHRRGARRLRDPQLACGVRPVPGLSARPPLVLLRHPQRPPEDDADRTARSCRPALGIGAFAEKTLVAAGQCTKVDPPAAPAGGRAAGLRGDGRHRRRDQHRRRRPRRLGRGHRLRRRRRRGRGRARGWPARRRSSRWTSTTGSWRPPAPWAPPTPSTRAPTDPVEAIRELTGGFGADVVIEAVGRPETYQQAFYARDLAGTVVLVGVPTPEMKLELPLLDVFGRGGALKSSWYGDCLPSRDFPMLIDLHLQGRLDLEAFVTETIGSTTSRRPSSGCTRATSCARW